MRTRILAVGLLVLAACTEPGTEPNSPLLTAPSIQLSMVGDNLSAGDLCGGLSPCDAYDYRGDETTGAEGVCFLPPTVDNHLSDPACSAPNRPGLSGFFQLAWCQIEYSDPTGGSPPSVVPGTCQNPNEWEDLVEASGHYAASVRWTRGQADVGDMFRVYVVRGEKVYAYRDLVVDPNLTTPADGFVHSIGYGNEPLKVVITEDFDCLKFDTQTSGTDNAATCLISDETVIDFVTDRMHVTFVIPDQGYSFLADFEVSECLTLGYELDEGGQKVGLPRIDAPLADCKLSVSSDEITRLSVPGQLLVDFEDERWDAGGPFEDARLNLIGYDELGLVSLPHSTPQSWYGDATSAVLGLRWLGKGLDVLAGLFGPEPVAAGLGSWDWSKMTEYQVFLAPVMDFASSGTACASGEPHCLDLGTFDTGDTVNVSIQVSAPSASTDEPVYPDDFIDVPYTRLHFFPESGTVVCPPGSAQVPPYYVGCVEADGMDMSGDEPTEWEHVVVITDGSGIGSARWALADGSSTLRVSACAVARPGPNEANPPSEPGNDYAWGVPSDCTDRVFALTDPVAVDNGPADGPWTPFEPVDSDWEVAAFGLPLTFQAATCPTINVDGFKTGDEWDACATKTIFTAPVKGPKVENNAALYTYSDGDTLYVGIEVQSNELGNKIFLNFVENGSGVEAAGDEILVIDFGDASAVKDWYLTPSCVGSNGASLCGAPDTVGDGVFAVSAAGEIGGAGAGRVFYEFKRPLGSPNSSGAGKQDLGAAYGDTIGLKVTVTQGQGGGKGGFVYPDPQGPVEYHIFTIE